MSDPSNKSRPDSDSHSDPQDSQPTEEGDREEKTTAQPSTAGADSPTTSPSSSEDQGSSEEGGKELGGKMTFLEHLDELRKRIIYSVVAVLVAAIGGWVFREEIYGFLELPIRQVLDGQDLVITKVTDSITIYLKVSLVTGIFVAAPVVLAQVWLFIAPGLYRREKLYAIPFLFSSTVLFLLGGIFAYYIILPTALEFLVRELGGQFYPMLTAIDYFGFELIVLVGMGLIFQLPVLVAFLSIFGMVTPGFLWRNFRYAFLLIVILAAVISPTPDALNLALWTGPMVLLYVVSIGISWIFSRRRKNRLPAGS